MNKKKAIIELIKIAKSLEDESSLDGISKQRAKGKLLYDETHSLLYYLQNEGFFMK